MVWLKRCGAFLIVFMICRTLPDPCGRSKLCVGDCCGFIVTLLLPPLSKMVGIAMVGCPKPFPPSFPLENKFNSLATASDVAWFVERRFRNDNDFKRLSRVDSLALLLLFVDALTVVGDECWCRSSSDDTNWSNTSKSAFIFEFRMLLEFTVLPPSILAFAVRPKRCASYMKIVKEKENWCEMVFVSDAMRYKATLSNWHQWIIMHRNAIQYNSIQSVHFKSTPIQLLYNFRRTVGVSAFQLARCRSLFSYVVRI